jgi:hypothetical protein
VVFVTSMSTVAALAVAAASDRTMVRSQGAGCQTSGRSTIKCQARRSQFKAALSLFEAGAVIIPPA